MFPDGEDFFVRSVRHFRDQIADPELKRQVAGFIGQEAMHGREHRAFNDRLDELLMLGCRAFEDRAARDVHVRRIALQMKERTVEARQAIAVRHAPDSCRAQRRGCPDLVSNVRLDVNLV